jgi:hypothetical protein
MPQRVFHVHPHNVPNTVSSALQHPYVSTAWFTCAKNASFAREPTKYLDLSMAIRFLAQSTLFA